MDISPGLRLLRRSWPTIVLIGLLAGVVAYVASYLVTPVYSSSTRVLVRAREARFLTSTAQDLNARPGALDLIPPKSLSQTLGGLATSRPVAEQVVRELKLDEARPGDSSILGFLRSGVKRGSQIVLAHLQYGYYTESPAFEGAVSSLQRSLEAIPIKDSYLIDIKARSDDPAVTAAIANAAARAFVGATRARFQESASGYRSFLEGETQRARAQVKEAEEAIRRYKDAQGITDIAEESKSNATAWESLRQNVRDVEADLSGALARYRSLQQALSGLSPVERTTSSAAGRAGTSTTAGLETGRSTSTSSNEATTETSESRDSVGPNRVYQEIQRSALLLEGEIAGFEAKRQTLVAALEDKAAAASILGERTARLSELELSRRTAHEAFAGIESSYAAAVLNNAWGVEEVTQVEEAVAPLYPERPIRYVFGLIGLVLGLGGAVAIMYALDAIRWRVPAPQPEAAPQPALALAAPPAPQDRAAAGGEG